MKGRKSYPFIYRKQPPARRELAPAGIGTHCVEAMMKSYHVGPGTAPAENNESITALVAGAVARPTGITYMMLVM